MDSLGFRGYGEEAKKAVKATIEKKLKFLDKKMDVEVDFKMLKKDKLKPGEIQVYLVEQSIGKERIKKLLKKHGIKSPSAKLVNEIEANMKSGHGLNVKDSNDKGPGLILVPVSTNIADLASRYPGQTDEQLKKGKENMGKAIAELSLHELGHGFGLKHTKKKGKEVATSSPPLIMDTTLDLSSPDKFDSRDFTGKQKKKLVKNISKWMGIKPSKRKKKKSK